VRVGIDLSPLRESPVRGVGRALAHVIAGLHRTAEPGDEVVGFATTGPLPAVEGLDRVRRVDVPGSGASPVATRASIARCVPAARLDSFVSPWSAFPALDVPVVVVVHELPFVRLGPIEGVRRSLAHRFWLRRDVSLAARIVVPSRATRDDLLALYRGAEGKVVVIPHGFDPTQWQPASPARPVRQRPWQGVVVGATNRRKGLDVLLDADDRLRDVPIRWHLVGEPPRGLLLPIAARDRVRLLGRLGDEDLRVVLQASDLLVYPSRSEGFGYPPLEAMAAGCPVVASRAGSIPEVCADAALLVEPDDPEALATGIRGLLSEPELREDLVARGRVRCRAFPVEECGARWWAVLRRAAAGEAAA
jgi:glycosyltransferase involved in cell wall biosynthesis